MEKKTTTTKEKVAKTPVNMEAALYNSKGEKAGTVTMPEELFGLQWNADLVHQVVTSMQANARTPVAHTKDRGEVRGGGRKPWAQKGTGRARHGSSRSPIWKGGGITHGPRNEKSYAKTVSRQMRQKALLVVLSRKMKDGEIIFIDSLQMEAPKTSVAKNVLTAFATNFPAIGVKKTRSAFIALPEAHKPTMKSFANFNNITIDDARNLNPVSVLASKYLVIANPASFIETLSKKKVAQANKESK